MATGKQRLVHLGSPLDRGVCLFQLQHLQTEGKSACQSISADSKVRHHWSRSMNN